MSDLTFLDIMALVILALSTLTAVIKGITAELISLAAVIAGFLLAVLFYETAAEALTGFGVGPLLADFLGFTGLFLLSIVVGAIVVRVAGATLKVMRLRLFDRALGGVFGLARGWLINIVIFVALAAFPVAGDALARSQTAEFFLTSARLVVWISPAEFKGKFWAGYQHVTRRWREETRKTYDAIP